MARVTVEDCVDKIPNRYELLMVAAQRAKDISDGAQITLPRDNDKNTVIALREIADETVSIEELQKELVIGLQKFVEVEEPEEEELEILAAEKELSELDDEFSNVLLEADLGDDMQLQDADGNEIESEEVSFDEDSFEDSMDFDVEGEEEY